MGNAWALTQWMIIGPSDENSPSPDGVAPLFFTLFETTI